VQNLKFYAELALGVMGIGVLVVVHALVGSLVTWHMFKRSDALVTRCPMCKRSVWNATSSKSMPTDHQE
jgi:hypothetical protein